MPESTKQELLAKIDLMETQLQDVKEMTRQLIVEKEWYTTAEIAARLDISNKTAANYCGDGTFTKIRKCNGRWQIHKSELSDG